MCRRSPRRTGADESDAAGTARQVAKSRPVKAGARIGLVAYGITHLLIAWLALQVAFGQGGEQTDQNGAFQTLAERRRSARSLLWVLVVGFVAVALWRLEQAVFATAGVQDQHGADQEAGRERGPGRLFIGAGGHRRPDGDGLRGEQGTGQEAAAGVLGLAGRAVPRRRGRAGAPRHRRGEGQARLGEEVPRGDEPAVRPARPRWSSSGSGRSGSIAKAVAIGLIGMLVVVAAVQFDPSKANGLDPALKALAGQPFGMFLLAIVAVGLAGLRRLLLLRREVPPGLVEQTPG